MKEHEAAWALPPAWVKPGLWLVLGLGAARRLAGLNKPFWLDEDGHLQAALAADLPGLLGEVGQHAAAAPLDYLLLRLYAWLSGASTEAALRLPYVFYGLVTIWLLYKLGKSMYNPTIGLAAAYLLATSSFHIHYSQEVRFYALSALLGVLSTIAFFEAARRPTRKKWLAWGMVCLLGLYTHYFLVFVFSIQLGWLFWQMLRSPTGLRLAAAWQPLAAYLSAGVLLLPWYLWAGNAGLSVSLGLGIPFGNALLSWILGFGPALVLIALLGPLGALGQAKGGLLLALTGLPFLGAYLLDNWAGYFFNPRQVIFSLPFALLLTAASLEKAGDYALQRTPAGQQARLRQVLRLAAVGLLLAMAFANANLKMP